MRDRTATVAYRDCDSICDCDSSRDCDSIRDLDADRNSHDATE